MTLSHWFRDTAFPPTKRNGYAKTLNRANQLDNHLRSIVLESNQNPLLRQLAGLDKSRIRSCGRKVGAPKVYEFRQEYDRNRKQKVMRMKKAMQQFEQFRSHPVPNFDKLHKRLEERNKLRLKRTLHKVTEPKTPQTLLKSQESSRRWEHEMRKLQREQEQEMTHQPNLGTKFSDGWRKPPFVPQIWSRVIKTKPFKLRCVKRGEQRKQFDMWTMQEQESRWQLKAIEWQRRCVQEYRQARKMTNFKAQPVPKNILRGQQTN